MDNFPSSLPESSRLPVFPSLPYTGPRAVREHPKVLTETRSSGAADDERGPLHFEGTHGPIVSFVESSSRDSLSVVHLIEQNGEGA